VRSFVLANRGFAVYPVATAHEARATAEIIDPEVIALAWPFEGGAAMLDELHALRPYAGTMVIADELTEAPADLYVDAILLKGACSQAEITDCAKSRAARKRGPRKQCAGVGASVAMAEVA